MSAAPGPLLLGDADCTGLHLLKCSNLCPALDDACVQSQCAAGVEAGVADVNALIECNATCSASCG